VTVKKELSAREKAAQKHVAHLEDLPPETPEETAARRRRNHEEWLKARSFAKNSGNTQGVEMLDEEMKRGAGVDFPDHADDDLDFEPDLDFQPTAAPKAPSAPRASQADIRAVDGGGTPMDRQSGREKAFEQATQEWIQKTGGLLKPGQNVRQAVAEFSGLDDPETGRAKAEQEHLTETGELVQGNELGTQIGKPLAAIAGFLRGGPGGATAAEAAVRAIALSANLQRAMDAGTIDADQAQRIFLREYAKGVGTDAAFNYGVPLLAKAAAALGPKIPGVQPLLDKVLPFLKNVAAKSAQKAVEGVPDGYFASLGGGAKPAGPSFRDTKIAERQALTEDPNRKAAIEELARRAKAGGSDTIPTPGQVTGEAGMWETNVRKGAQPVFNRADKTMESAADDMLYDATSPEGQMARGDIGRVILDTAEKTQAAVKQRLRPVFQQADDLGIKVDLRETRQIAAKALAEDARVPNGALNAKERAELEGIFEHLRQNPLIDPESALDFISRRKEVLRNTTADWVPSKRFETITDRLIESAEKQYRVSAHISGQPEVARDLMRAQREYRQVMSTVYEDAVEKALRKEPELVGKYFWQNGATGRIAQLNKLLRLAEREGTMGKAGAEKLKRDMARGFLQDAMRDRQSAATFSQKLKENVPLRETWDALTAGSPEGKALRETVSVIEQAAQLVEKNNLALAGGTLQAVTRANSGGMGVAYSQGTIKVPMFVGGLSLTGLIRGSATAYTTGETGVLNSIAKVARLSGVGTPAATKAAQAEATKLIEWYKKQGLDPAEGADEQSEQPAQQPEQSQPK
jgi:hypothetical protein